MTNKNPFENEDDVDDADGNISGPSQRDMDRSWEDHESGKIKDPNGLGSSLWKIVVVGVSVVILLAMGFGTIGPLLNRSSTPQQVRPEQTAASVLRVIDGRTIVVSVGDGEQTVRMIGIEAPQFGDFFYDFAQEVNQNWIGGQEVLLEADERETDEQGRLLRYVYFDDIMINAALILNGLGKAETEQPNTRYSGYLADMERRARVSGVGIWDPAYEEATQNDSTNTEARLRLQRTEELAAG
jgi:endonuclease YncB( thermonuclease family)